MPQHQHQCGLQGGHHLGQRCGHVGWRRGPFGRAGAGCGAFQCCHEHAGVAVQLHGAQHVVQQLARVTPQGVGGRNAFGHDEPASAQPWRRLCRVGRGVQQLRCVQAQRRGCAWCAQSRMSGWRRRCGRGGCPGGRYRARLGHGGCGWQGRGGGQGHCCRSRRRGGWGLEGRGFGAGPDGHAHLLQHGALARIKVQAHGDGLTTGAGEMGVNGVAGFITAAGS